MAKKATDACINEESLKYSRDVDMPTCVAAVKVTLVVRFHLVSLIIIMFSTLTNLS